MRLALYIDSKWLSPDLLMNFAYSLNSLQIEEINELNKRHVVLMNIRRLTK